MRTFTCPGHMQQKGLYLIWVRCPICNEKIEFSDEEIGQAEMKENRRNQK